MFTAVWNAKERTITKFVGKLMCKLETNMTKGFQKYRIVGKLIDKIKKYIREFPSKLNS